MVGLILVKTGILGIRADNIMGKVKSLFSTSTIISAPLCSLVSKIKATTHCSEER